MKINNGIVEEQDALMDLFNSCNRFEQVYREESFIVNHETLIGFRIKSNKLYLIEAGYFERTYIRKSTELFNKTIKRAYKKKAKEIKRNKNKRLKEEQSKQDNETYELFIQMYLERKDKIIIKKASDIVFENGLKCINRDCVWNERDVISWLNLTDPEIQTNLSDPKSCYQLLKAFNGYTGAYAEYPEMILKLANKIIGVKNGNK